jgi:hypothetical protein
MYLKLPALLFYQSGKVVWAGSKMCSSVCLRGLTTNQAPKAMMASGQTTRSASGMFQLSRKATPIQGNNYPGRFPEIIFGAHIGTPGNHPHWPAKQPVGYKKKSNWFISKRLPATNKIAPAAALLLFGVFRVFISLFIVVSIKLYPKSTALYKVQQANIGEQGITTR